MILGSLRQIKDYAAGGCHSARIDGIFGSITEESVKAFQKRRGLVPDGIVGSYTWLALSKVPH